VPSLCDVVIANAGVMPHRDPRSICFLRHHFSSAVAARGDTIVLKPLSTQKRVYPVWRLARKGLTLHVHHSRWTATRLRRSHHARRRLHKQKKAMPPTIIEHASSAGVPLASVKTVRPRVANTTDGAPRTDPRNS
jgi:hypothetical protein